MHLNKRQHMELLKDRLKEMFHEKNSSMKHNLKPVSQNGNFPSGRVLETFNLSFTIKRVLGPMART
jgi:hypothetical protein